MFFGSIKRFRYSLGGRISAWYALGFIVSFVLIGLFASWVTRNVGRSADRAEILGEFEQDSARCRQIGSEAFLAEFERKQPDIDSTLLRLSDAGGRTLLLVPAFGESPQEVQQAEPLFQRTRAKGWQQVTAGRELENWQVYAERLSDGFWLQVAKSDRRGRETRRHLHAALLPVALFVVLLALTGAAVLTARALLPVRQLIATTRAVVQGGDMTARVPVRANGGNELDELKVLFNQMLARNESLIRGMREALDHVAHDLRTPLTRLRSVAETSLRDPSATVTTRGEALADAIEESERTLTMLRVLTDISEAEHGTMRLHVESLPLIELVTAATDLYEYVAEERGVRLCVNLPANLYVKVDRIRIQQVIANLIDNALKYSPSDTEVAIEADWENDHRTQVWMRVRDRGIGISDHDLPRIWDRLYRGNQSRSEPGSGLGLSLVKAIVQAHGGKVEVVSLPNQGSDFTIILPAAIE